MNEFIELIVQSSIVAQVILAILFFLSVMSWALIVDKMRAFHKVSSESKRFFYLSKKQNGWGDLYQQTREFRLSPFAQIFKTAYKESYTQNNRTAEKEVLFQQVVAPAAVTEKKKAVLNDILAAAANREMAALEQGLIFLATAASASPFLGLFGTVWGVMSAFLNIGQRGSAEISVIGPGIAEALITTAAGLAVAIPALVAYNYFVDRLRKLGNELADFSAELVREQERGNAG